MDHQLKKIAKGNTKAQSSFYDEFSPLVMGICRRYIPHGDEALDVFQESFIKIFGNIHQVEVYSALKGWIRRVTINTALDHLKGLKYQESLEEDGFELSDQFYESLLDKMTNEVILDVISRLPEGYRIVFNLSIIDGYSHKEIAERLSITESTSRSQLTHARKLLKKYLNELGITRYEQVI